MDAEQMKDLEGKLEARVPKDGVGCNLCEWILEDLRRNKKLTGSPPEPLYDGSPVFPAEGKARHLMVEGFWKPEMKELVPESALKKLNAN